MHISLLEYNNFKLDEMCPHTLLFLSSDVFSHRTHVHPSVPGIRVFVDTQYHTEHALVTSGETKPQVKVITPLRTCPFP